MSNLLLIDQDESRCSSLQHDLQNEGLSVTAARELTDMHLQGSPKPFDVLLITDEQLGEQLPEIKEICSVIVLATQPAIDSAVSYLQAGAKDYLEVPAALGDLLASIERLVAYPTRRPTQFDEPIEMFGSSDIMNTLRARIAKVGPTDSAVLVLGQSGTGKELVAKGIHAASMRSHAPLITLNCATVPDNLIETELFGIEPLSSAQKVGRGLVEAADRGTLFLDEIAELSPSAQAHLLQVLQGNNRKVGSAKSTPVDVRIIAATHKDLKALTEQGAFRSDLFYRLNVVCFELSPLRNRPQDIIEIGTRLLAETCRRLGKPNLQIGDEAMQAMLKYHWPGNVRELSNAIERAVILADEDAVITQSLLAIEPVEDKTLDEVARTVDPDQTSLEDYFVRFVQDNEEMLTETELAEKLGISRKSLWERRQRLSMPRRKTRKRGSRASTGASADR